MWWGASVVSLRLYRVDLIFQRVGAIFFAAAPRVRYTTYRGGVGDGLHFRGKVGGVRASIPGRAIAMGCGTSGAAVPFF